MSQTRYQFSLAMAGFFELATEDARRLLPARLSPLEVHYGRSILVVNLYDFTDSEVGPYREVVYGIMVPPRITDGVLPAGAVFPWQVATTTAASRQHAIERWRLPHFPEDVSIDLERDGDRSQGAVHVGGTEVMRLEVTTSHWKRDPQRYLSFQHDDEGLHMASILYEGDKSEHEEGTGVLTLSDHAFNKGIFGADFDEVAFREMCQVDGQQTFEPLLHLG